MKIDYKKIESLLAINGKARIVFERKNNKKVIVVQFVSNPTPDGKLPEDKSTWVWQTLIETSEDSWEEAIEKL